MLWFKQNKVLASMVVILFLYNLPGLFLCAVDILRILGIVALVAAAICACAVAIFYLFFGMCWLTARICNIFSRS